MNCNFYPHSFYYNYSHFIQIYKNISLPSIHLHTPCTLNTRNLARRVLLTSLLFEHNYFHTTTMNTWDEKIQIQLLQACDLESCLALADTCQSFRKLVTSDSTNVMHTKVVQRIPWIRKSRSTWSDEARVVAGRSREVVKGKGWTLRTAVDTKTGKAKKRACTDFPKAEKTRKAVVPCFEDEYTVKNGAKVRDAKIVLDGSVWDVREATTLTEEPESDNTNTAAPATTGTPEYITLTSGEQAEIVNSNKSLVHLKLDDKECVVHQSRRDSVTLKEFQKSDKIVYKLMNDDGGALMMHRVESITPYIAFIEPTVDLKRIVICNIPKWACNSLQFLTYDGFLVLYFSGRVVRLWVDLGYQKRVHFLADFREVLGFEKLAQISDTRALCATEDKCVNNLNFDGYTGDSKNATAILGRPETGMNKYVTLKESQGKCVGDLTTGQTWFAASTDIVIPCEKDNKLVFHAVKKATVTDKAFHPVFEAVPGETAETGESGAIDVDDSDVEHPEPLKTPSNVGSAFFDDSTSFVPFAELKLHTAPFTKAVLTEWDRSEGEKDNNKDWSIKPGTMVLSKAGLKKHAGRDKSGKVIKKKPAKKRREMVWVRR